nr:MULTISPECIES: site-specific integrase [Halorhodospira]
MPYSRANKRSFVTDQQLVGKHVLPYLGDRKLINISKKDVEKFLDVLAEKGLKPSTRKRIVATLSHVYTIAMEQEIPMVTGNPVKKAKKPKVYNEKERILSKDEIEKLLKTAKKHKHPHLHNIIKLLILTGARRSEVLNARFSQFNLQEQVWYVNGKSGPRKVMLPNSAVDLVCNITRKDGTDLLFPKPGTREPYKCINDPFKRVLRKAGLDENIRVHDLRHTFASLTLKSGAGLPEVQRLLGHSSINTTMRYIHLLDSDLKKYSNAVAEKINA